MDSLANEGIGAGLAGTLLEAMIEGRGGASVDVCDGLEGVMADGQEAGGTGGIKDDCRGTLVCRGTTGEATGRGRGSCETGDGIIDWP